MGTDRRARRGRNIAVLLLVALIAAGLWWWRTPGADRPGDPGFDARLGRALVAYMESREGLGGPTVRYRLLRDGPTIVGVAAPKYYLWVEASVGGRVLRRGAARVAADEMPGSGELAFDIVPFVSDEELRRSPDKAAPFPADLRPRILALAAERG